MKRFLEYIHKFQGGWGWDCGYYCSGMSFALFWLVYPRLVKRDLQKHAECAVEDPSNIFSLFLTNFTKVKDRSVYVTSEDKETLLVKPEGLQEKIGAIVGRYKNARAFIRSV